MIRILKQTWRPHLEREALGDGSVVYFASHPEAPGVDAMGETEAEAIENWIRNMTDYAEDQVAHGARRPAFTYVQFEIVPGPVMAFAVHLESTSTKGTAELVLTR